MTTLKSILEIDPSIIRSNIQKLKNKTSNTSNFLAVIKSDAYGHMLNNIVSDIDDLVDGYGVVRLDEAIDLRKISQKKIVLMQGIYSQEDYLLAKKHDLDLGFEIDRFLEIYKDYLEDINFTLMTHLAASNKKDDPSNAEQFERFERLYKDLHNIWWIYRK